LFDAFLKIAFHHFDEKLSVSFAPTSIFLLLNVRFNTTHVHSLHESFFGASTKSVLANLTVFAPPILNRFAIGIGVAGACMFKPHCFQSVLVLFAPSVFLGISH
jgi:hypothetical protein